MVIEWVGCSGAGKSTARDAVYKNLRSSGVSAKMPLDLFWGSALFKAPPNERFRNAILDLLVLPFTLVSILKHRNFLNYCRAVLGLRGFGVALKIALLRSILRKY